MTPETRAIVDTMRRHPDAELTVIRKWASGTTHLAWVGGWEHSVDMTEVIGSAVIVARPPLPTLCGVTLRGPWPFRRAGDLVICIEDGRVTCRRCRAEEVAARAESPPSDPQPSATPDAASTAAVGPDSPAPRA